MNTVYYLCETDNSNLSGLVFPKELDDNTYSPGFWYIEIRTGEKNPKFLEIKAVLNGQVETLILNRDYRYTYFINLGNFGRIYLRLTRYFERHKKYIGKSNLILAESKLFQIVPVSVVEIEGLCREYGFYFIGQIDNDLQ